MVKKTTRFDFNMAGGAYRDKLSPEARKKLDALGVAKEQAIAKHKEEHERDRLQKIAEREKQLTKTHEMRLNMPRPGNAPAPKMPTREEIQHQAMHEIEDEHVRSGADLETTHQQQVETHVAQELGMSHDEMYAREAFMDEMNHEPDLDHGREF